MLDDYQDAINKRLIEVKHVGLTDLQRAVDKALRLRVFTDTVMYAPRPKYWIALLEQGEN